MKMSTGLDSPMEALAINYLTHTLWAWIAFLTTAALSFWKLKKPACIYSHNPLRLSPSPPPQPPQTNAQPEPDQQPLPSTTSSASTSNTFCLLENRKSGKFMVYYGQDGTKAMDDHDDINIIQEEEEEGVRNNKISWRTRIPDGWEAVLKLKTAEMGWYRLQDLTVLHGNVVRLWNCNQFNFSHGPGVGVY